MMFFLAQATVAFRHVPIRELTTKGVAMLKDATLDAFRQLDTLSNRGSARRRRNWIGL
jgi:hypothetical protein